MNQQQHSNFPWKISEIGMPEPHTQAEQQFFVVILEAQACNPEPNHKLNGPFCDHSRLCFFSNHRLGFLSHFGILSRVFSVFFLEFPEILLGDDYILILYYI